jgi:predicted CopG family antitoxin
MIQLTINLTEETYEKLKKMANHSGSSLEEYINYVILYRYGVWIKQNNEWSD